MHEDIKRKAIQRDAINAQLDAIRKAQDKKVSQLTKTFTQMVDDAIMALERKIPLY